MTPQISALIEKIRALESELDAELAKRRAELRIGLEHGRIAFEEELLRRHRELRQKLLPYLFGANPLVVLTAPVIYAGIIPFVLLDFSSASFRQSAFPSTASPRSNAPIIWCSTATISPISTRWKTQLRLLLLRQRDHRLHARDRGAHRAILVPDQARAPRHRHACALCAVRRLRRWRELSGAARRAARRRWPRTQG